jgi:hypothetical protein
MARFLSKKGESSSGTGSWLGKISTLERVQASEGRLGALLKQNRHHKAPMPCRITDQRLEGRLAQTPRWTQMPGREHLAAAPHHFY